MQKELAKVLRDKIVNLPFIDIAAGMCQTLILTESIPTDEMGGVVSLTKRMPVSSDVVPADACKGPELLLIPNSARKSILYFEDFGTTGGDRIHGMTQYTSRIRLICWLNRKNLVGDGYTEISGRCIATIVDMLVGKSPENISIFTRLTIKMANVPPQDAALFGRYTYNEKDRQYLRPPFEFFGIDFLCTYLVPANCLSDINWNVKTC